MSRSLKWRTRPIPVIDNNARRCSAASPKRSFVRVSTWLAENHVACKCLPLKPVNALPVIHLIISMRVELVLG